MPLRNIKEHKWSEEDMQKAIAAVREKQVGYLKAAKHFNVPRTTLFIYCRKNDEKITKAKLGREPVLYQTLEKDLVEYAVLMDQKFFGLTRKDIRSIAFQLARRNNLPNRFSLLTETAGKDWLKRFLQRHGDTIRMRRPTGTSAARVAGFNKENVTQFFDLLEGIMQKNNFPPDRIYSVDESGLCIVQSKCPQVISLKGKKQVEQLKKVLLLERYSAFTRLDGYKPIYLRRGSIIFLRMYAQLRITQSS